MSKEMELSSFAIWVLVFVLGIFLGLLLEGSYLIDLFLSLAFLLLSLLSWLSDKRGSVLWLLLATLFVGTALMRREKVIEKHHRRFFFEQAKRWNFRELLRRKGYWAGHVEESHHLRRGCVATVKIFAYRKKPSKDWSPLDLRIRLTIRGASLLSKGAQIRFYGRLRYPRTYWIEGFRDRSEELGRQGIFLEAFITRRNLLILRAGKNSSFFDGIDVLRFRLGAWIAKQIEEKEVAGLLRALLLGERGGLNRRLRQIFAQNGVSHLLAISGLHLAIVASFFYGLLLHFFQLFDWFLFYSNPKKLAAFLSIPGLFIYTLLSGASWSTIRAFVMVTLFFFATIFDRRRKIAPILAMTALSIILAHPQALFSLSFQLSFLAVISLSFSNFLLTERTPQRKKKSRRTVVLRFFRRVIRIVGQTIWASIIATAGTLPLVLSFSPYLPLHGPLVNVIAIPLGGYFIVGIGLFGLVLGVIFPILGNWILQCAALFGKALIVFLTWTASFKSFIWKLPPFHIDEIIAYYLFLIAFLMRRSRRWFLLFLLLALGILGSSRMNALTEHRGKLLVHFLDVGQGDAAFLEFPNGQTMLLDSGGEPFLSYNVGRNVLLPFLRWHRVKKLDYAVLSHPHPDHFRGFRAILPIYPPKEFWHNDQPSGLRSYRELRHILKKQRIRLRTFEHPTTLTIGEVRIKVLHPFPGAYEGEHYYWSLRANNNSLVLLLRYKKVSILFAGDIERRGEELIQEHFKKLHVDVLKVPHHGSRTSSSGHFLDYLHPHYAIFSLGRGNPFGFPHPEVIQRYRRRRIRILRTDQMGTITLITDGKSLHFRTFRRYFSKNKVDP